MCVYRYVCVCVCVYACGVCTQACLSVCIRVCMYMCVHVFVPMCVYVFLEYLHIHVCVCRDQKLISGILPWEPPCLRQGLLLGPGVY